MLVDSQRRFGRIRCPSLQGRNLRTGLLFYPEVGGKTTTRFNTSETNILHSNLHEKIRFHIMNNNGCSYKQLLIILFQIFQLE